MCVEKTQLWEAALTKSLREEKHFTLVVFIFYSSKQVQLGNKFRIALYFCLETSCFSRLHSVFKGRTKYA